MIDGFMIFCDVELVNGLWFRAYLIPCKIREMRFVWKHLQYTSRDYFFTLILFWVHLLIHSIRIRCQKSKNIGDK